jgi:hypothetical protein
MKNSTVLALVLVVSATCLGIGYRLRVDRESQEDQRIEVEAAVERYRTAQEDWDRRKAELTSGMASAASASREKDRQDQLDRIERDLFDLRMRQSLRP